MRKYIFISLVLPFLVHSEPPTIRSSPKARSLPLTSDGRSPFVKIAKELLPTVVSIQAERVYKVSSPLDKFFEEPFFEWFFKRHPEFQFPKEVKRPILGSGIIVSEDGYILTNNHIVRKASKIIIKTIDEKEYTAEIVGTDPETDIAVVKIDAKGLKHAILGNSDEMEIGDWVMAIGNPFQLMGTVTVGVISAKERKGLSIMGGTPLFQNFIQTDAAINPGNSGGPLVNLKGEVIGINTAIKSGGLQLGNIGIGFAIPSNMAKRVMNDLIKYKEVKRGWFGVQWNPLTPDLAEAYGLKEVKGVLISKVLKNTPAERAGIKPEDIVLEWDGKEVSASDFPLLVAQTPVGKRVKVKVWRNKRTHIFEVKVGIRPVEEKIVPEKWFGMEVASLLSEEAKKLEIDEQEGVVVIGVESGSEAELKGIRRGDVIKKIGNKKIRNLSDYEKIRKKLRDVKKPIIFKIKRGERIIFVALKKNG
jgi:serine protease Do